MNYWDLTLCSLFPIIFRVIVKHSIMVQYWNCLNLESRNIANRSDINKEACLSKIDTVISSNKIKGVKQEICFLNKTS